VQAGLQGHDVVLIGSSENAYNYSVVARPGTTRIEQLKGKRLGFSRKWRSAIPDFQTR
jgi:ABC-type nitrate/sulfonate/bicarbonate transport system substrate-binding protein